MITNTIQKKEFIEEYIKILRREFEKYLPETDSEKHFLVMADQIERRHSSHILQAMENFYE